MQLMDQIAQWLARHGVTAMTLATTIALLVAALLVIAVVRRLLQRWLRTFEARLGLTEDIVLSVTRVITTLAWVVTALVILDLWGVGVGGIWTLMVSAAAVVGVGFLATWAMVSNMTASLFILIWRPFHLGDMVEVLPESLKGRVVERNLMFVVLREEAGSAIWVPNNLFFQKMFRVSSRSARPEPASAPAPGSPQSSP
jgi:small-conductance mechanosensitive channel